MHLEKMILKGKKLPQMKLKKLAREEMKEKGKACHNALEKMKK